MTLQTHIETNAHVTGCLFCGKPYEQLIEEAVSDYLHQTTEPGEAVRDGDLKGRVVLNGLQSDVFTFVVRTATHSQARKQTHSACLNIKNIINSN